MSVDNPRTDITALYAKLDEAKQTGEPMLIKFLSDAIAKHPGNAAYLADAKRRADNAELAASIGGNVELQRLKSEVAGSAPAEKPFNETLKEWLATPQSQAAKGGISAEAAEMAKRLKIPKERVNEVFKGK